MKLKVAPLTADRWADVEAVFKARGCSIARSCWCMCYRRGGAAAPPMAGRTRSQVNRAALRRLVNAGRPRSPVMKPVDEQPVWSLVCFVVPPQFRGQGVARALLKGAVAYAKAHQARLLEAYPVDRPDRSHDDSMWFGAKSMYDKAGFKEVARRKPNRPVVRLRVR